MWDQGEIVRSGWMSIIWKWEHLIKWIKIYLDSLSKALECKPLKIVCKVSSFEKDQDKINFNERIKKHSQETEKYII